MSMLEARELSVRFGGHMAVDAVDLDVDAGQIIGLIGPNGAGKTTTFNVLTGLQVPTRGKVSLEGRDITKVAAHKRARLGLARTFQRLELFGTLTVRENIRVATTAGPRRNRARRTDEIIERLALGDVADQRADALSTGAGRVVELGRCLASAPSVVLLDEPASGQDEHETARFATVLRELAADGIAILLVEHDMELVMDVCDQLHVLDFGRTIATGTPDEIRADPAVQAAYLGEAVEP